MSRMLSNAIAFAAVAHADQTRKYTGEPYVTHTIEVMMLVRENAEAWDEDMLIAAVLHDTVEDTLVTLDRVEKAFGSGVASLVDELTDRYTKENYPDLNRKARKEAERNRLAGVRDRAKTIKLADLISNTRSISVHDQNFAVVYLREKEALLPLLRGGDQKLWLMAQESLTEAQLKLMWRK